MINPKILGAILLSCSAFSLSAEAKLYKWVDDKGETHYGEVVPPEFAAKDKVQFDDKGHVIKEKAKVSDGAKDSTDSKSAEEKSAVEQRRKDKALLNTYSNEKEIDLARDRNLQQVEARISSVQELQKSAQENLDSYRKEATGIKAGKKIPAGLQADIAAAESRVDKLKQDLDAAKEKEASVRASYEADKVRYRELTGGAKK